MTYQMIKYVAEPNIRFRRSRNPVIGDEFSSRHGQKGVYSQLWPNVDMPSSGVTGMRPDLIINPHAFPSRMTIAMLLESIAAKESESESNSLVDELGSMLMACGFNHHGVEVLYSGVYETELTSEIFIGPIYYQRLRHMVSDKFQVFVCHTTRLWETLLHSFYHNHLKVVRLLTEWLPLTIHLR
ncbi:hypothetical protein P3S67_001413 [Capsicum chacoense]